MQVEISIYKVEPPFTIADLVADSKSYSLLQVKVWFQNRRTKYKRDRVRDAEVRDSKSESSAACNILRMLQRDSSAVSQCTPGVMSLLPAYHPYAIPGYSST